MRIDELRTNAHDGRTRVSARLTWETFDRPPAELYYERDGSLDQAAAAIADAFVLAAAPLAMWQGERRVALDGAVCPRLRDGMEAALRIFAARHPHCVPPSIEPAGGFRPGVRRASARTVAFVSGGVDALAMLRGNRLDYPVDHPGAIREALYVFGLNTYDFDAGVPRPERIDAYERHRARLDLLGARNACAIVPVRTNLRSLYPDYAGWEWVGWVMGVVSIGLAVGEASDVWLASPGMGLHLPPAEMQGMFPHLFSTDATRVQIAQPALTRFDKIRLLADWPDALEIVRPCLAIELPADGRVNCGRCEKCVRTMLAFAALGVLDRVPAFRGCELTADLIVTTRIGHDRTAEAYEELVEPLRVHGRPDLARAVENVVGAFRASARPRPSAWRRWLAALSRHARGRERRD